MLTKSATIILGIIQEHPINAYELIKVLSTFRIKDWYEIADSSVYATLKSLEKKNYIIGETQKSGNMPDKTVYSLTSSGKTELKKTIKNFIVHFDYDLVPFLIACFFVDVIGREDALSCLQERYDFLLKNSDGLKKQIQKLESDTEIPAYVICNVEHNCMIVETEISATQKMIASLQETK